MRNPALSGARSSGESFASVSAVGNANSPSSSRVPKLLEKYCQDNGYEIVAMLSEPASTEGVSFPMKYAIIGLNMEEDVNTIITLSKDMIGATDETVIDTLGKLSEYDIYVEDINGELEECYEMMYKEPVQESDIRGLVLDTVSKFYHNIRDGR